MSLSIPSAHWQLLLVATAKAAVVVYVAMAHLVNLAAMAVVMVGMYSIGNRFQIIYIIVTPLYSYSRATV